MSTCHCSIFSPFRWREHQRPSIFLEDGPFTIGAKTGKTMSIIQSETVERITRETGRNPGSIRKISKAGDARIEEAEAKRRNAKLANVEWNVRRA